MSIVRDVSVSCAELKLVTVRVAKPRHRSTVEKPGLRDEVEVGSGCGISRKKRALSLPSSEGPPRVRSQKTQVAFGLQSIVGYEATCLPQTLTIASSFSPLGSLSVADTN